MGLGKTLTMLSLILAGRERNRSSSEQSLNISVRVCIFTVLRREFKQRLPYTGGVPGIIDATVGWRSYKSRANWSIESSSLSF